MIGSAKPTAGSLKPMTGSLKPMTSSEAGTNGF
jgi:hypothetical protein